MQIRMNHDTFELLKNFNFRAKTSFTIVHLSQEYLPTLINFTKEKVLEHEPILQSLHEMLVKFYSGDYNLNNEDRGFYLVLDDVSNQFKGIIF